jgi:hypothetical protein
MDRTRSALPLVVAVVITFVAGLQIASAAVASANPVLQGVDT